MGRKLEDITRRNSKTQAIVKKRFSNEIFENEAIKNKVAEYYTNEKLQTILMKIWSKVIDNIFPLHPVTYQKIIIMVTKALGNFGDNKYYATKIPEYK